jgi:predicted nucleic acid-binding protein
VNTADLDAALGDAHRAYIDTSACIAYLSTAELAYATARHLFQRVADPVDPLTGYISIVSAAEMLVRPIRAGDHRLSLVTTFLREYPNLHMLDATLDVGLQAANIRALTVTNDERWSRRLGPLFPQFTWIYLGR